MIKSIIGTASLAALISTSAIAQYVAPSGSDYANQKTEVFTEDAMNEFLSMANAFACIQKNARGDLAALANATWEASISEVECGLAPANEQGAGNSLARAVMRSSRASSTSPQETSAWFDSSNGGKFVSSMNISKSPTDFAPYGAWYTSYLMRENAADASSSTTNYTTTNTPIIGFVDISNPSGSKVLIQSAERAQDGGNQNETVQSKIEYTDSTLNSATLLGKFGGTDDQNVARTRLIAGRTSATHYFRVELNSATDAVVSTACLLRGSKWSTAHRYEVFNKATGKKVALDGAFGFEYGAAGAKKRGWFDLNGAWFDKGAFAFNDSTKKTLVVQNKAEIDYTLSWAPGNLYKKTAVTETPANSTVQVFTAWVPNGDRVTAKLSMSSSGAASLKYYQYGTTTLIADPWNDASRGGHNWGNTIDGADMTGGTAAGGWRTGYSYMGWMFSEEKRQNVYWDGNTTITVDVQTNISDDATLLAANHTFLVQHGSEGILPAEMPVNLTLWAALGSQEGRNFIKGDGSSADDSNKTADAAQFYFTGLAPTGFSGIMPRTLYLDVNPTGPSSSDKPVMFDFARNEGTKKYEDFASTKFTGNSGNWSDNYNWPQSDLNLRDAAGVKYRWNFGANGWDQSVIALTAAGAVKPLDQPLMLTYEHTTAKELNTVTAGLTYFANTNMHTPAPALCPLPHRSGGRQTCNVKPDSFNNKKFVLEYNGSNLHGLPRQMALYVDGGKKGNHVALVNPKNGVTVVGNDGVNYVLKATEVGTSFIPAGTGVYNPSNPVYYDPGVASQADCDDLSFDALADLGTGWTQADLPVAHTAAGIAKWPQSSYTWKNLPIDSLLKCSVSKGIPSGCEQTN